jgi:hypothetical protein
MVDVTLLEVNLEDASFDAHAPFSGRRKGGDASESEETGVDASEATEEADEQTDDESDVVEVTVEDDDEEEAGSLAPVLVGGALAVAAVAAWRLRNRRTETVETDEEVVEVEV